VTVPSPVVAWRTIIRESDVRSSARLVALMLSTHMDRNGGSCFPSLTTLSGETGLGRSTVCRALNELDSAGLIRRVRQGRGRPTRYLATSPATGLPVVPQRDSGSPALAPEDVQEDVHTSSRAPAARAGRGRRAGSAPGARRADEHADLAYLDAADAR
jgi:DNA-binding transcriptional MocR family regulator